MRSAECSRIVATDFWPAPSVAPARLPGEPHAPGWQVMAAVCYDAAVAPLASCRQRVDGRRATHTQLRRMSTDRWPYRDDHEPVRERCMARSQIYRATGRHNSLLWR